MVRRILLLALAAALGLAPTQGLTREKDTWCSRAHARQVVMDFIDAYNSGAFRKLDKLFGDEPDFGSYRIFLERDWPAAEDRKTLIPYFRDRHAVNDHFELVDFRMNKERGFSPENIWGFSFQIRRTSDDPLPRGNAVLSGKGGADCKMFFWSASWAP